MAVDANVGKHAGDAAVAPDDDGRARRVAAVHGDAERAREAAVDVGDEARPAIYCYDTMKGKVIGPEAVEEKFGVGPRQLGDLLARKPG